jgi:predicted Zn-dependent peptidase
MQEFDIHTLDNGITLIHQHNSSSEIAHCGLIVHAGSRDESIKQQGLAHFIEHVLFKGTKKRKSFHILNRLEIIGGELNAYTTKEETAIYASVMYPYYERSLELLGDIVFNATFPEKELEKEKEVILDEINSYRDNPVEQIHDDFEEFIFPNHPLGHPILGTLESVKSFTKRDIQQFIKQSYASNRIVFSSIGNIPFSKVLKLASKYLEPIPKNISNFKRLHFKGYHPSFNRFKKETFQSHCVLGNIGYENKNKKKTGLVLLNNLLGGPGMNSRLNLGIREKYGFTYNLESNYSSYEDTGLFTVYLGTDNNYLERTIDLVHKELKKLRDVKLGTLQLKNAKQQLIGQIAMGQEHKVNLMLGFGKSMLTYGKIDSLQKTYKKIEMTTAENLLEIANEVFCKDQLSTMIFEGK